MDQDPIVNNNIYHAFYVHFVRILIADYLVIFVIVLYVIYLQVYMYIVVCIL